MDIFNTVVKPVIAFSVAAFFMSLPLMGLLIVTLGSALLLKGAEALGRFWPEQD